MKTNALDAFVKYFKNDGPKSALQNFNYDEIEAAGYTKELELNVTKTEVRYFFDDDNNHVGDNKVTIKFKEEYVKEVHQRYLHAKGFVDSYLLSPSINQLEKLDYLKGVLKLLSGVKENEIAAETEYTKSISENAVNELLAYITKVMPTVSEKVVTDWKPIEWNFNYTQLAQFFAYLKNREPEGKTKKYITEQNDSNLARFIAHNFKVMGKVVTSKSRINDYIRVLKKDDFEEDLNFIKPLTLLPDVEDDPDK